MKKQIGSALIVAAMVVAVSFGLKRLVAAGAITHDQYVLGYRALNVAFGLGLAWFGDTLPKRLGPVPDSLAAAVCRQSFTRSAGPIYVVGGLVFVLDWLIAPFRLAAFIGTAAMLIMMAAAVARCLMLVLRARAQAKASVARSELIGAQR